MLLASISADRHLDAAEAKTRRCLGRDRSRGAERKTCALGSRTGGIPNRQPRHSEVIQRAHYDSLVLMNLNRP